MWSVIVKQVTAFEACGQVFMSEREAVWCALQAEAENLDKLTESAASALSLAQIEAIARAAANCERFGAWLLAELREIEHARELERGR
jgi:regulator of protease activity HflC (stomatin/prohibitin superfamily)